MNTNERDPPADMLLKTIMEALQSSYGSLSEPDFRFIAARLRSDPHRRFIDALRTKGIEVTETTDPNDDVSTQLVATLNGDSAALELSVVGQFAILRRLGVDDQSRWVKGPGDAAAPLFAEIVRALQRAGMHLLDRQTVSRKIVMSRADGESQATLYQALFSDTDRIP